MLCHVEAFFVVVIATVLLGLGVWALAAARHLLTLSDRRAEED
jgi:hypothetical protein